jgi:undecaprenyl diphosphate synthase
MDGNGRWAKKQGKKRIFGHQNGVRAVRNVTEACAEIGVQYLTLYAFSTENWDRPRIEVNALMELLVRTIRKETKTLMKNKVRLRTIGDTASLPGNCHSNLKEAIDITKDNDRMDLILALSYSARWELTKALKEIAVEVENGRLKTDQINEQMIQDHLCTIGIPDPELLIRTSGEHRISNFLLWQIAYSELYFTDKLWPDFRKEDLFEAVFDYQNRERRFGKTSEQLIS